MTIQRKNHKFNKSILSLIRHNRQKYLRKSLSFAKKKIIFFSGINYLKSSKFYYLKKDRLRFYSADFVKTSLENTLNNNNSTQSILVKPQSSQKNNQLNTSENIVLYTKNSSVQNVNANQFLLNLIQKNTLLPATKSVSSRAKEIQNYLKSSSLSNSASLECPSDNYNLNSTSNDIPNIVPILKKNKYKLSTYLFNVICKLPRKYIYNFIGKEVLRKYYTMPLRLSITRFILNKILKGYYQNLSHTALSNLCTHKSLSKTLYQQKKELAKNLVLKIEERLDNSLLRLLNFKSLYTIKRVTSSLRLIKKYPKYSIKSPLTNYTSLQIKQLINHGHIFVNNKKIKSGNFKLQSTDEVQLPGYIRSLNFGASPKIPQKVHSATAFQKNAPMERSLSNILSNDHKNTLLLRKLKQKDYLKTLSSTFYSNEIQQNRSQTIEKSSLEFSNNLECETNLDLQAENNLKNLIKTLRIKRFTEIFYITYKNLHLLDRLYNKSKTDNDDSNIDYQQNHIEKHVKPLFDFIGHNQSIFLLWPVMSMLKITSWNSKIKQNILQFPLTTLQVKEDKQKLQNLLRYKRFLNKMEFTKGSANNDISDNVSIEETENLSATKNEGKPSIPTKLLQLASPTNNNQLFLARSSKCYASILYGTRICKWIRFQQGINRNFHNKIYNKLNFFEWELEFFQYIIQYYK